MADRTVSVRLQLLVDQYKQNAEGAAAATRKISGEGEKAGSSIGKSVGSATKAIGIMTGAALTGTAVLGASAIKTGSAFNSLKQTSGAALKTVMGSAKEAKAQMDKLNEFGRDSWVMRDVLIRAQQQMTGFGVETKKVIPYLDGLQEAVAAAGGNSQTFEELAGVMAKVKSEGKISATTFREFGVRGVDAASIIGEAMGKTGDEIRASVTKGSLGADEALDALAEGMKTKFDGATENLRDTFRGAVDNLSAAWRDLSATISEPLVDPAGGGLAVDWANAMADAMGAVQQKAEPAVDLIMKRLNPSLEKVEPIIRKIESGINGIDLRQLDGQLDKLGKYAPAIGGVAAGLAAMGTQIGPLQKLGIAINPAVAGITALVALSPDLRSAFGEFMEGLKPLVPVAQELGLTLLDVATGVLETLSPALGDLLRTAGEVATMLGTSLGGAATSLVKALLPAAEVVSTILEVVAGIPAPVLAAAAAFGALQLARGPIQGLATSVQSLGQQMQLHASLAAMSGKQVGVMGSAMSVAQGKVVGLGNAMKTAFISNPLGLAITGITAVIGGLVAAQANAAAKTQEHKQQVQTLTDALIESNGAMTENVRQQLASQVADQEGTRTKKDALGLVRELGIAQGEYTDAIMNGGDAQQQMRDQLMQIAEANKEVIETGYGPIEKYNEQGKAALDLVNILDEQADVYGDSQQAQEDYARENGETTGSIETQNRALDENIKLQKEQAGNNLSQAQAELRYQETLDATTEKIKENGKNTDITTKAGQENQKALLDQASSHQTLIDSMQRNNASSDELTAKMKELRDDFIRNAEAAGYTADEAKDLADQYGLIPDSVLTTAELEKKDAEDKLKRLKRQLKDLEEMKPTPQIKAGIADVKRKIKEAEDELNGIDGKTATVTVKLVTEGNIRNMPETLLNPNRKTQSAPGVEKHATGGAISGPGTGTSDSILAKLSNGEHVFTAEEVRRLGGQSEVYRLRDAIMSGNLPAFAKGGAALGGSSKVDEEQRKLERERLKAIREMQADLRQGLRRGSIRDSVTSGLSGGYSQVDQLFRLGDNEDLSRGSRSKATSSARKFEANLRSLYSQADRIDEKLKKAQDKATELKGISDSVVSGFSRDKTLDFSIDVVSTGDGNFKQVSSMSSMTGKTARLKELVSKLGKLSKMGIPGALLQEVASQGVEGGNQAADALLGAPVGERNQLVSSWAEFDKYAGQAGQYVTEGFYKGGLNAADGVVKGLEGRKKNVESAIANLAKVMESTFKSVLGIHSPSRVMADLGGFTAEGLVQGMLGSVGDVQSAAAMLGAAAVPGAVSMDVGVNPVIGEDQGEAGFAMQDMSATTLDSMAQMQEAVALGWEQMLFNTQTAQAGMLLDTQLNQSGMLMATQTGNAGQLLDTQTQQAAMLLNTQTQNQAMLLNTQVQQEAMRATVLAKQTGQRTAATEQQELMRLMLADKQSQMKLKSSDDFESLKNTTGAKFSAMRTATDTTMVGMHGDYSGRLADLKSLNKTGFESLLDTSNRNMRGVRDGIDSQMAAARPELGGRMNDLISVLRSFTVSVNKAFGDVGVKLDAPAPLRFAGGGVMPGYTPGRDVHHFRSTSAGDLYLSGGEGILRPETTRMIGGEQGIDALNRAARTGNSDVVTHMLGGMAFADGGVVPRIPGVNAFADSGVWRNLWAITKDQFPNAQLTSAYRGGSRTVSGNASHHSRGNAIDVSPSMDIFNFWRNKYGANLAELIYSPANGKQIKNGQNHMYTGAVRGMHFNHVHIAAVRALSDAMAGGLPGMGGAMSHPFLDRAGVSAGDDLSASYAKAAEKLTQQIYAKHAKQLPGGIGGQLGKGIMSQVSEGLVGKAKEYGKNAGSPDFSNVANGPIKTMARQMLEQMGWGDQFGDLNWLLTRESGWNPTAQNPSSSAYGLFQFLNGTWGTVGGSKTSDPRKQLEYGLKYIKQRYGDVKGARSFWNSHNWYEGGTERAKRGLAVVGEKGPELVNFRGGEQVMSTTDSMKFMSANRTYIPHTGGSGFDSKDFATTVASAIKNAQVTPEQIVKTLDGLPLTLMVGDKPMSAYISTTVSGIAVGAGRAH